MAMAKIGEVAAAGAAVVVRGEPQVPCYFVFVSTSESPNTK